MGSTTLSYNWQSIMTGRQTVTQESINKPNIPQCTKVKSSQFSDYKGKKKMDPEWPMSVGVRQVWCNDQLLPGFQQFLLLWVISPRARRGWARGCEGDEIWAKRQVNKTEHLTGPCGDRHCPRKNNIVTARDDLLISQSHLCARRPSPPRTVSLATLVVPHARGK